MARSESRSLVRDRRMKPPVCYISVRTASRVSALLLFRSWPVELPNLERRTRTLERRVDPGISVVQEWIDSRPLSFANIRPKRRKHGNPARPTSHCGEERRSHWIRAIVSRDDEVRYAETPEWFEVSSRDI